MTKKTKADIEELKQMLREELEAVDAVFFNVTHVARSGMSRRMKMYTFPARDDVRYLSYHVAMVLGRRYNAQENSFTVIGGGMCMCAHTLYSLAYALYPDDEEARAKLMKKHIRYL